MPMLQRNTGSPLICPKGHRLPRRTAKGACTPVACAGTGENFIAGRKHQKPSAEKIADNEKRVRQAKKTLEAAPVEAALTVKVQNEVAATDEEKALTEVYGTLKRRHVIKMAMLEAPVGLTGEAAEQHADAKLVALLPAAVGELEWMLKYGDDKQRENAAKQVLDSTGRGKREVAGASTPSIVINLSPGAALPWRTSAQVQVVDAPGSVSPLQKNLPISVGTDEGAA